MFSGQPVVQLFERGKNQSYKSILKVLTVSTLFYLVYYLVCGKLIFIICTNIYSILPIGPLNLYFCRVFLNYFYYKFI